MTSPHHVRCPDCGTIVAEIRGQLLILRQQHHGEEHVTVINLVAALEMLDSSVENHYTIIGNG